MNMIPMKKLNINYFATAIIITIINLSNYDFECCTINDPKSISGVKMYL